MSSCTAYSSELLTDATIKRTTTDVGADGVAAVATTTTMILHHRTLRERLRAASASPRAHQAVAHRINGVQDSGAVQRRAPQRVPQQDTLLGIATRMLRRDISLHRQVHLHGSTPGKEVRVQADDPLRRVRLSQVAAGRSLLGLAVQGEGDFGDGQQRIRQRSSETS